MTLPRENFPRAATFSIERWASQPVIYEINTWVWLRELSQTHGHPITLANIPSSEIEELSSWGFDAIWLMGVWHRGHATRLSALNYLHEYRHALPDVTAADVPGSAFAIRDYRVEEQVGGRDGLAAFRRQLAARGLKLILDFVPNHVATDHRWTNTNPEFFIRGTGIDADSSPGDFFSVKGNNGASDVIARGRDPYFPSWIDTAQLNAFHPGLRRALIDILLDIGDQCDGVRYDMAMLMMNDVFAMTWGQRGGTPPQLDFWNEVLPAVRGVHPGMIFLAEVYWGLEHELQLQGFDFTYDKRLYDRVTQGDVGAIKAHLGAEIRYARKMVRFIENHDEERAMASLGAQLQRAAATLICTLPGAALLHQGQLSGHRVKLPVQINRRPAEVHHPLLERFYRTLLSETRHKVYRLGQWQMVTVSAAYAGDDSHQRLIAYSWDDGQDYRLIVLNLSRSWSRAHLDLSGCGHLEGQNLRLHDVLSDSYMIRATDRVKRDGLLLEAAPASAQIFHFQELDSAEAAHGS